MRASALVVILSLSLSLSLLACSSMAPAGDGTEPGTGTGGAGSGGTAGAGAGGAPVTVDGGAIAIDAASGGAADETWCGPVALAATKVVPAGKTLAMCAGTTVTAMADGVSLTVQGKLLVQGTAASPVTLVSAQGGTNDWGGLIIDGGGMVSATYLEIRNATIAFAARPGSAFDVDHIVIESSDEMMILSSGGTIAHGTMRGLGNDQSATPILISNASPHISDTAVTAGYFGAVDMIVVGGPAAAPVFDRLEVADSHCAFHFDSGNGASITNSNVHHNAYGLMVIGSVAGHVNHNNFQDNDVNIGSCAGGSSEVKDNYFATTPFDGSCTQLIVTGVTPSGPYLTGVGPAL